MSFLKGLFGGETPEQELQSLFQQTNELMQQGNPKQALATAQEAVGLSRQLVGETHPDYATSLTTLGTLFFQTGNYDRAEPPLQEALEIRRKALGETHPVFAASLYNLGLLYLNTGRRDQAEPLWKQALEIRRQALGQNHPAYALSLHDLGLLYVNTNRRDQAEPLLKEAVEIRRKVVGETHPAFAASLYVLGLMYFHTGQYNQAEPLWKQTLQIRQKVWGQNHPAYAEILSNLGSLYNNMSQYDQAEPLLKEALQITRQALGQNHLNNATILYNLAGLYHKMGRYDQAEPLFRDAVEITREAVGPNHPEYALRLNGLGLLRDTMGRYDQAEPLYREAREVMRKSGGEDHPNYAAILENFGNLYHKMGHYDQAEPLLQEAVELRRQVGGESHPDLAASLVNLGTLHHKMGHYDQAESLYREAREMMRKAGAENHPDYAVCLANLGMVYESVGRYDQAEPMLNEAREITRKTVGENHPDYATRLTNLGILYESMGQYGQAEPLYRAALEILRKVVGENHPDYAVNLSNLGKLYDSMGQPDQAESLLKQAVEIRRKAVGKTHPDYAGSLGTLGVLYINKGQYDQAEPLFHEAVEISRQVGGENHPNYAACLSGLAYLCRSQARLDEALQYSLQAVEVTDQVIGQIFAFGSDPQRMVYLSRIQHETELLYSLVSQDMPDRPEAIIICFGVWLRRKALGTEGALVQREALLSGRYPALAPHIQQFKRLGQQLNDKLMAGPGDEAPAAYRAQLNAWQTEHRALEAELARQIPEMNLTQKMRATNPVAVAQALPPHTMLVEFVRFAGFEARLGVVQPARYLAFVLPAQQPEAVKLVDLGEAAPLEQLIAEFRATITGESETRGPETRLARRKGHKRQTDPDLALGQALRQAIFDPLRPALADCRRVFLSPDGDLTRLPFEILPAEGAGQRLIDTYTFSYLSVGRDVLRFGAESSGSATAPLVLADPDFDLAADQHAEPSPHRSPTGHSRELHQADLYFSRLPGTRLEGEQIARLLGVTPLLGAKALESQLKKHTSPRILHLATHGYFLEDRNKPPAAGLARSLGFGPGRAGLGLERLGGHLANPLLRCGLALAGANTLVKGGLLPDEAENAILNGEDVAGMDLLTTELVVLSACETGLGQVKAGEGVFGLRRAFMLAGAKTLVMSLWAVPDHHTQLLMTDFYSRILADEPRAEALRQAQLTLKATYDEPRYWGAFICQGEPGPLPR